MGGVHFSRLAKQGQACDFEALALLAILKTEFILSLLQKNSSSFKQAQVSTSLMNDALIAVSIR